MTLAIRQVIVPRMHRKVHQGQTVKLLIQIEDINPLDIGVLADLDTPPVFSVFDPSGVKIVTTTTMLRVALGQYVGQVDTTGQPLGLYTATFVGTVPSSVATELHMPVFKIIRLQDITALGAFGYLAIKDQSGMVWYWYIGYDDTLVFTDTVPHIPGWQQIPVDMALIPYWLQMNNANGDVRYVMPSLDGTAMLSPGDIPPPVGFGFVGTVTLAALSLTDRFIIVSGGDSIDTQAV